MILTPIDTSELPEIFAAFEKGLGDDGLALAVFARIKASLPPNGAGGTDGHHAAALRLAAELGIPVLDEDPHDAFSWDGYQIRTRSEPSVLIHEIAHWQLCAPERRRLYDFGLGAGPETGRTAEADAVVALGPEERQDEECLTSLLGILWEVKLGQPGILAFMEQNWLEGYDRPGTPDHFRRTLARLRAGGFLDERGCPTLHARRAGQIL
jgi:hypothetical protein